MFLLVVLFVVWFVVSLVVLFCVVLVVVFVVWLVIVMLVSSLRMLSGSVISAVILCSPGCVVVYVLFSIFLVVFLCVMYSDLFCVSGFICMCAVSPRAYSFLFVVSV